MFFFFFFFCIHTGLSVNRLKCELPFVSVSRWSKQDELQCSTAYYCQLEKELLAVVFALQRFDQYVYGRAVIVESDHQPLETISKKPLRDVPRRIQRMMLKLQRYDVTITYKRGTTLVLADTLSRAYLPETEEDPTLAERVFHTNTGQEIELVEAGSEVVGISDERLQEIAEHTAADSSLQQLKMSSRTAGQTGAAVCRSVSSHTSMWGMSWWPTMGLFSKDLVVLFQAVWGQKFWSAYMLHTLESKGRWDGHVSRSIGLEWMQPSKTS